MPPRKRRAEDAAAAAVLATAAKGAAPSSEGSRSRGSEAPAVFSAAGTPLGDAALAARVRQAYQ